MRRALGQRRLRAAYQKNTRQREAEAEMGTHGSGGQISIEMVFNARPDVNVDGDGRHLMILTWRQC